MKTDGSSTARFQRGPSEAARCASTEDRQAPSSFSADAAGGYFLFEHGNYLRRVKAVCEAKRTRASFTRGPGGREDD